ncbi:MAG: diguanylate cyclase, partial [Deltaproteobacteria bacterium]|nr:diguanylate cyclase [Deltaproteobacteria bacterium]
IHVTISLGVTEARQGDTSTSILARADKALYESKSKGRNRVTSN